MKIIPLLLLVTIVTSIKIGIPDEEPYAKIFEEIISEIYDAVEFSTT